MSVLLNFGLFHDLRLKNVVMFGERFVVIFQKYSVFFILLEVDLTYFIRTKQNRRTVEV